MNRKFLRTSWMAMSMAMLSGVAAAEVVVVVHPSNGNAIDSKMVQRIFLGKEKKFGDGTEANPINQATNDTRSDFDSNVLGRSSTQVAAYWSKLVFTGKGIPPKEVGGDADVIAAVAADPTAIGYVDSSAVTGDVKAITLN